MSVSDEMRGCSPAARRPYWSAPAKQDFPTPRPPDVDPAISGKLLEHGSCREDRVKILGGNMLRERERGCWLALMMQAGLTREGGGGPRKRSKSARPGSNPRAGPVGPSDRAAGHTDSEVVW